MNGWIKLHRKFTDWEWFNISEMVHLFIYLLINANNKDGEWRGISIKRGQILTGLNSLNKNTKISIQTLRTCLKRLENTKEINIKSTNKYSIITICKYDDYQIDQQADNTQTNKQLTINQQTTNNKQEYKEGKEEKENKIVVSVETRKQEFYNSLIPFVEKYSKETVKAFFIYWSELNPSGKKMKWEFQKTWETNLRIIKWASNENKFTNKSKIPTVYTHSPR
jgi:hypothetical protein